MNLAVHDPGGVATRRAIRAAVALPVSIAIAMYGFDDLTGAVFAVFGTTGLLVNADFPGSVRQRLTAYLLTGVAGALAIVIGWTASLTLVSAVLVTVLVAFITTFLNVFRGALPLGGGAALLMYVVAVCIGGDPSSVPAYLAGWLVAVVVSTITALLLLPRTTRPTPRPLMAAAFTAGAQAAETAWGQTPNTNDVEARVTAYDAAVDALTEHLNDQVFSTSGVTQRDGILSILANQLISMRLLVDDAAAHLPAEGPHDFPQRTTLEQAVIDGLRQLAHAMEDVSFQPSAAALDAARASMADGVDHWVMQVTDSGMDPPEVSRQVAIHHQLRIFALLVEQMMEMARVANGGDVEQLTISPPVPKRSVNRLLAAQVNWTSPWLRNAIRSGLGLGIGVLVMNLTGVDHGFWVLLAVIAVLRFDAVGTRRFAVLAVVGTAAGVVVGLALIALVGAHPIGLWILLPLLAFAAAWAGAAVNFPSGQAAFSAMVLIALGILAWPPDPTVGLVRIEDIAIGAAVAFVVGLLLWPRGAAGYLRAQLAESITASGAYLDTAVRALTQPDLQHQLPGLRDNAIKVLYRAGETFDVANTQRGPAADIHPWIPALNLSLLVESVGRIIGEFALKNPSLSDKTGLTPALTQAEHQSAAVWNALAAEIQPPQRGVQPSTPTGILEQATDLPLPTLAPLPTTQDARCLVIAVWVVDWVQHLTRVAPLVLPQPTGPAGGPHAVSGTPGTLASKAGAHQPGT
jgi:uncharacterized membrane protein YccC